MMPKRPFQDGGDQDEQGSKRFKNSVRDILRNLSMEDLVSKMEPFLRTIVRLLLLLSVPSPVLINQLWLNLVNGPIREEVEDGVSRAIPHFSSKPSSSYQPESSARRGFLLRFADQFPSTIFTNSKIGTKEGNPMRILLVDAKTMSIVTTGPLSSMKIEIVALDGDFCLDEQEDWSASEFAAKIIRQRDGRRPLVTGDLTVTLKGGVGTVGDVAFTDNSSWIKCRRFRVGAISVLSGDLGVKEARSAAFVVKDHRGESYKKHHPPSQNDEIWRLEKIAKEGAYHKRLANNGIEKVREFMQMLAADPSRLRGMFDGISNKMWDTIISHAEKCVTDEDELYAYNMPGRSITLLFNSIYKLQGATFDGNSYEQLETLNSGQMALVENLKRQAYRNVGDFVPINARSLFGPARPLTILQADHVDDPNMGLNQLSFSVPRHDVQPHMSLQISDSSTSSSYHRDIGTSSSQFEFTFGQQTNNSSRNSFKLDDFVPLESLWPQSASLWPLVTGSAPLTPDELSPVVQTSPWTNVVNPTTWGQPGSGVHHVSRIRNPKERWFKLKVALKLGKFMRDVQARRAQLLYVDYNSF